MSTSARAGGRLDEKEAKEPTSQNNNSGKKEIRLGLGLKAMTGNACAHKPRTWHRRVADAKPERTLALQPDQCKLRSPKGDPQAHLYGISSLGPINPSLLAG